MTKLKRCPFCYCVDRGARIEEQEEAQKEGMVKTHIRYKMYEDAWKIQKWLKENWPDYVIMITGDHISIVNRKVKDE